jgi:hypothetical protein
VGKTEKKEDKEGIKYAFLDLRCGSCGRVLAYQALRPEFKPHYTKKEKNHFLIQ